MLFYHDGKTAPFAPIKHIDDDVDYGVDWSGRLQPGETVASSVWVIEEGLTSSNEINTGLITGVMLSGGDTSSFYVVSNKITTSLGRTIHRSMVIECRQL